MWFFLSIAVLTRLLFKSRHSIASIFVIYMPTIYSRIVLELKLLYNWSKISNSTICNSRTVGLTRKFLKASLYKCITCLVLAQSECNWNREESVPCPVRESLKSMPLCETFLPYSVATICFLQNISEKLTKSWQRVFLFCKRMESFSQLSIHALLL